MPSDEKVNILIVDDRAENLVALEALLGDLGQKLVRASSGKEALKQLLHDDFAVILLDVQMPEMDGFETAALIRSRERSTHTPIVFLTAINKDDEHVARGYAVGAVDYLFKPIVPLVLKSKVAAFVDLAQKTRALEGAITERQIAELEARRLNEELDQRVRERTAALAAANGDLEREIAERRKLEAALHQRAEELAESHRAKDQFLAMLGHELRNPLAPIRNAVTAMRLRGTEDPLLQRAQDVIDRQVQHLSRLVDDLLDVARITRGKIELRHDPIDLVAIAEHAMETSRSTIHARRHALEFAHPPEPIWVLGDSLRLEQVITNLLTNAAKYTDPGGRISLTIERQRASQAALPANQEPGTGGTAGRENDDVALLRVRDTGRGIPREMLSRIFDIFTQAAPSLDRAQGGLGLGLTLVHNLVQMHGGSVAAHSDGLGQGSEFVVSLPILAGAERGAHGDASERPVTLRAALHTPHSRRVLVVDDNADAAATLADLLALWGHEVRVAHTGLSAIEIALAYQPDLVLLDIGLPGMDGYEVARRLRACEETRGILLVAITGYGQEEDRRRSQEATLDYHLTKPVDPEALQEVLAGP